MKEIKIRYRNGFPTRKCMQMLIDDFFKERYAPIISTNYGKYDDATLWWSRIGINERIDNFSAYLKSHGIEVEKIRKWDSPLTGTIHLKQQ